MIVTSQLWKLNLYCWIHPNYVMLDTLVQCHIDCNVGYTCSMSHRRDNIWLSHPNYGSRTCNVRYSCTMSHRYDNIWLPHTKYESRTCNVRYSCAMSHRHDNTWLPHTKYESRTCRVGWYSCAMSHRHDNTWLSHTKYESWTCNVGYSCAMSMTMRVEAVMHDIQCRLIVLAMCQSSLTAGTI